MKLNKFYSLALLSIVLSLGACGGGGSAEPQGSDTGSGVSTGTGTGSGTGTGTGTGTSTGTGTGTTPTVPPITPTVPPVTPTVPPVTPTVPPVTPTVPPVAPTVVAPQISTEPQSLTVTTGGAVTFRVSATGTDLQYQWRRNGVAVSGATQASYTLPASPVTETETQWSVTVSNSAGSVTSAEATLRVWATPGIRVLAGAPFDPLASGVVSGRYSPVDGQGTNARFVSLHSLAVGQDGMTYVGDGGTMVRKISPDGVVSFLAGGAIGNEGQFGGVNPLTGAVSCSEMGPAAAPCMDLTVDAGNNLFVADTRSFAVRKVTPSGTVTTLAGEWFGPASTQVKAGSSWSFAGMHSPIVWPDQRVSVLTSAPFPCGLVTVANEIVTASVLNGCTYYGWAQRSFATGGIQQYAEPVIRDPVGYLLIATKLSALERISESDGYTLIAGSKTAVGYVNQPGAGARFGAIRALVVDSAGNAFVADADNKAIRKITPKGVVSTVAGTWPTGETPPVAALQSSTLIPYHLGLDEKRGRLLVTDASQTERWVGWPIVVMEIQMAP